MGSCSAEVVLCVSLILFQFEKKVTLVLMASPSPLPPPTPPGHTLPQQRWLSGCGLGVVTKTERSAGVGWRGGEGPGAAAADSTAAVEKQREEAQTSRKGRETQLL